MYRAESNLVSLLKLSITRSTITYQPGSRKYFCLLFFSSGLIDQNAAEAAVREIVSSLGSEVTCNHRIPHVTESSSKIEKPFSFRWVLGVPSRVLFYLKTFRVLLYSRMIRNADDSGVVLGLGRLRRKVHCIDCSRLAAFFTNERLFHVITVSTTPSVGAIGSLDFLINCWLSFIMGFFFSAWLLVVTK